MYPWPRAGCLLCLGVLWGPSTFILQILFPPVSTPVPQDTREKGTPVLSFSWDLGGWAGRPLGSKASSPSHPGAAQECASPATCSLKVPPLHGNSNLKDGV